ncbi:GNAT family N-acetyltransferase [Clostridium sp. Marseille-QA1073]
MNIEIAFNEFPVLESENLILKKIESSNIEELYEIYSNEKVFKYCGIIPKKNIKTISNMVTHFERDYNKRDRIKWGVFLKNESDILVGIIEAMDFKPRIDMVTIGYFLSEPYWGEGIASQALRILIKFLFEKVDVNRIQAEVMPENEASKKVLFKNGFIKEGLLRQATLWSGKGIVDLEIYSILKEDYKE